MKTRKYQWLAAVLLLLLSPLCLAETGMDAARLQLIPKRMREFVEQGKTAGVVTLIARHGEIASLEAVGYQDLESKKPMRTDTIFQIMSMTKPASASAPKTEAARPGESGKPCTVTLPSSRS